MANHSQNSSKGKGELSWMQKQIRDSFHAAGAESALPIFAGFRHSLHQRYVQRQMEKAQATLAKWNDVHSKNELTPQQLDDWLKDLEKAKQHLPFCQTKLEKVLLQKQAELREFQEDHYENVANKLDEAAQKPENQTKYANTLDQEEREPFADNDDKDMQLASAMEQSMWARWDATIRPLYLLQTDLNNQLTAIDYAINDALALKRVSVESKAAMRPAEATRFIRQISRSQTYPLRQSQPETNSTQRQTYQRAMHPEETAGFTPQVPRSHSYPLPQSQLENDRELRALHRVYDDVSHSQFVLETLNQALQAQSDSHQGNEPAVNESQSRSNATASNIATTARVATVDAVNTAIDALTTVLAAIETVMERSTSDEVQRAQLKEKSASGKQSRLILNETIVAPIHRKDITPVEYSKETDVALFEAKVPERAIPEQLFPGRSPYSNEPVPVMMRVNKCTATYSISAEELDHAIREKEKLTLTRRRQAKDGGDMTPL
ncbi:MAG TPA: hypothetical protein VM532_17570, partial [Burkholderiales bacterium]|nr:hypothetical protein [Burkholderiales bacterium]